MNDHSPSLYRTGTSIKDQLKLALGALIYPIQARRWRNFLDDHPALRKLAQDYPRIIHKIYRPYLSRHLGCADRVDILIVHYNCIFKAGLGELIRQCALRPVCIAEFAGKSGELFQLQLSAINIGHREGELVLQLVHDDVCAYSASFVLLNLNGEPSIKLGGLQGLKAEGAALLIKHATHEFHGCRPKNMLVSVVRSIGMYFCCSNLLMVSNSNRVAINGRRSRRILSNYDETWKEMFAHRRPDGNFEVPCSDSIRKNFELLPSHKRAQARRRAALQVSVNDMVHASLDQWKFSELPPIREQLGLVT